MLKKGGVRDEVAVRDEGRRLFDLAQLDLWASLLCALRLPSPKEPTMDRVALTAKVDRENGVYSNLIKASVDVLIYQDEAGYAAVMASLTVLEASVKSAFPTKPPQSVADIVILYEHAGAIETVFNQVTPCYLLQTCP